jgi:hypothetical protein
MVGAVELETMFRIVCCLLSLFPPNRTRTITLMWPVALMVIDGDFDKVKQEFELKN